MKPFHGRREDDRLLKGEGRYTADWNFPGQLYACFLRSDRAHAAIKSIDCKEALESPGVVAVFTGEDVAHFKTPPVANAVLDALRPLGIRRLDFPYSPLRVWQAISEKKA